MGTWGGTWGNTWGGTWGYSESVTPPTPEASTSGGSTGTRGEIEDRLRKAMRKELQRRWDAYKSPADAKVEPVDREEEKSEAPQDLPARALLLADLIPGYNPPLPAPPPIGPEYTDVLLDWLDRAETRYLRAVRQQDEEAMARILAQYQQYEIARRKAELELVMVLM